MRRLGHPNIVAYLGGQEELEKRRLYIFTEYAAGGSVASLIEQYGDSRCRANYPVLLLTR